MINSSQINSVFLTAIQTVDNVINIYSNKMIKTMSKPYLAWIEEYESSTANEYYDNSILNNIIFDSKISQLDNESFDILLDEILSEIFSQLEKFGKIDNIKINACLIKDKEYPDWEEFVISIKLPLTIINYDKYFDLWRKIGESVKERIDSTEVRDEDILEKYGNPIILLEDPEKIDGFVD
ncbi:hypothetical protein ASJ81_03610 [Methanosarcina spelaei]|uniref:Uncharacterized protein n=1 Tax=Methanosarcina spelaei TaxID=1036679 RepID=A0A2A2HWA5_9EURY|nr:hypothetical protein [Methanosarcina spelaei]PAV13554.1 hypothetical protein ASJ81_03610 [Methanosarcina spelaei]